MVKLITHLRLVSASSGYVLSQDWPLLALFIWFVGGCLDVSEQPPGTQKVSRFQILMDICSDNLLRSMGWMAAMRANRHLGCIAVPLVLLEWGTSLATQVHITCDYAHWKVARRRDPLWIQSFFRQQGRGLVGQLCLYGLFAADLVAFAAAKGLARYIPYYSFLCTGAILGRSMVVMVELWLCISVAVWILEKLRDKGALFVQSMTDTLRKSLSLPAAKRLQETNVVI